MTTYSQGQVVLIPFPFTNLTTTKQRPAVIVSSNTYNQTHQDVILAAITSKVPTNLMPDEYFMSGNDQKAAGLPKPSVIKLGKIVTIDQRLIRKTLGKLPPDTMKKLKELLQSNF